MEGLSVVDDGSAVSSFFAVRQCSEGESGRVTNSGKQRVPCCIYHRLAQGALACMSVTNSMLEPDSNERDWLADTVAGSASSHPWAG